VPTIKEQRSDKIEMHPHPAPRAEGNSGLRVLLLRRDLPA